MRQDDFGLEDHPLRTVLSKEMHARKLPPLIAPARLMQIILLSDNNGVMQERNNLAAICGLSPDALAQSSFFDGNIGALGVIWERHTEYSSYMFISHGDFTDPFNAAAFAAIPTHWIASLPGAVVRATQIAFAPGLFELSADRYFSVDDLVVCDVASGAGRIWADFLIHEDGFGRLLLIDQGLNGIEAALVVQRLQELGNYRNMALLGLPVAQQLTPRVTSFEQQLVILSSTIAEGVMDDETMLHQLSKLSGELAIVVAQTRYRMSASKAYAQISNDRLIALRIGRVPGNTTLADFTDRRLLPAVRTCVSFSARLDDLSQRLEWSSSLLRTRVETSLSRQNRDLLQSVDRRNDLQLRLQQTVEGLSVVAISYYSIGLMNYLLKGFGEWGHGLGHDRFIAVTVPMTLLGTWLVVKYIRRRLHD